MDRIEFEFKVEVTKAMQFNVKYEEMLPRQFYGC
jgi:hypothetical protein